MTDPVTTTPTSDAPPEGRTRSTGKTIAIILGAIVGVALVGIAALLLFAGGPSNDVQAYTNRPPKSVKYIDGLVIKANKGSFVLLNQQRQRVTLGVRGPDQPYIDVQHAQSHASLGQPVRVYWKTVDGKRVVVYMEDSAAIF